MKYKVDGWNNFCRVFRLPLSYPEGFCFGGGRTVNFQMVDWFNPVPDIPQPAVSKEVWKEKVGDIEVKEVHLAELQDKLIPFLQHKMYVKKGYQYIVICNFGASFIFAGE